MKKLLTASLAAFMALSLAACGGKPTQPSEAPQASEESIAASQAPEETQAAEESTEEASKEGIDLTVLYEKDESMLNTYSLLAINPDAPFVDADGNPVKDVTINSEGAAALINWLLRPETIDMISDFGYDEYGAYLYYALEGAPVSTAEIPAATEETKTIRMSTTTSVNDTGLLGYLLPIFKEEYGYTVEVYSAGTGKAIANAKYGNADLIMVHAKSQEEEFIDAGYSYVLDGFESERLPFLYNYFVLVGPSADPAGVKNAASVKDAFAAIAEGKYPFISRGDKSGTHTKELSLWPESLGITYEAESVADYADWYTFSNAGQAVCLKMAEETGSYMLSDMATFLFFQANNGEID